jgi:hypothetical protein
MIKNENLTLPEWIIDEMISYLYTNGMVLKNKELNGVVHVPVTVFPSPVVKSFFEKIEFYQIAFNKMIDRMSRHYEYLHSVLKK